MISLKYSSNSQPGSSRCPQQPRCWQSAGHPGSPPRASSVAACRSVEEGCRAAQAQPMPTDWSRGGNDWGASLLPRSRLSRSIRPQPAPGRRAAGSAAPPNRGPRPRSRRLPGAGHDRNAPPRFDTPPRSSDPQSSAGKGSPRFLVHPRDESMQIKEGIPCEGTDNGDCCSASDQSGRLTRAAKQT